MKAPPLRKRSVFILAVLVFFAFACANGAYAEEGDPFAGGDNVAPPPPPTDKSDFEGGADNLEPGDDFGFSPPPSNMTPPPEALNNTPPPPPSDVPPMPAPAPSRTSRRSQPPTISPRPSRTGSNPLSPPKAAATAPPPKAAAATTTAKAAPKLNDYLELDASVKGLEVKNFDLPDKDIRDVVTLISKWTGKNFILDSKVRGKITIIGPSQVTLQEAYQAFLSALDANGLTTVQSGKFIRIIESAEARRAPVKTYAGEYAPKDDQFITRVFQLKYINADEVQREFRDLATRQGKLFAYEPTNSIIITDTGSNIQRIKELLETLDVKSFETTLHVVKIKNNSAKAISEMLGEIYGEDNRRGGGGGQARSFRRSSLERTRGGGVISKIIPDEQTNSLVVLANQAGIISLKQLVQKLDVRVTDTGRIHVYYCEYAKAEDLAQTLASLSGSGGGAGATRRRSSTPRSGAGAPGTPPSGQAPVLGGSTGGGPVTAELGEGVKVTSDLATNALVIVANSSDYQTLKRVIKKLDIPRLQVYVESAIMEIQLDDSTSWSASAGLIGQDGGFKGGYVTDATPLSGILSNQLAQVPAGATIPGRAVFPNLLGNPNVSLLGIVNFITKNTRSSVLSTPQIIALDNEKATFRVQDVIPVVEGLTPPSVAGAQPTPNITNKKVGIDISLTPHVNAATRTIRLEIEQTVDSVKESAGNVPGNLLQQNIATTSRVTNTQVVVKDRDFVALGGLMSDEIREKVAKVPLLGDIPILGWLFKSKTTIPIKKNLVILLKPRIIGTSLASAELIDEKLKVRDAFIDQNTGSDHHEESVDELKAQIKDQLERGANQQTYDYTNTREAIDDEDEPAEKEEDADEDSPKPRPGEQSQLGPKKAAKPTAKVQDDLTLPPTIPPENPDAPLLPGDGNTAPPPAPVAEPGGE